jgi:hypothetical protein
MTANHTAPPPVVRPVPLAEINQHVEAIHDLLCDWLYSHPADQQVPREQHLGWLGLTDALEGIMNAQDRIRRGTAGLPRGGVNGL